MNTTGLIEATLEILKLGIDDEKEQPKLGRLLDHYLMVLEGTS